MAYRFVLDVPEAVHADAKFAISSVRDAQILIDRHPQTTIGGDARGELTVAAQTLAVIDVLYRWMAERDINQDIFIDAHKGGQLHLPDYDPETMRRMIQGD